jgi:anaerobic magnesium-protoporphyrin IX monomethyl ester cyclase
VRVLLVDPIIRNAYQSIPDLGLGYLATALKKAKHKVDILDCINKKLTFEQFEKYISSSSLDVVGFRVFSTDLSSTKKCLQIVKKNLPETLIIVGGMHPSILPQQTLKYFAEADFGFRGEAEIGLPKLLNKLPRLSSEEKEKIPGLIWRNNGKIISNSPTFTEDLDTLGMPDWDLINPRDYNYQNSFFTKSNIIAPFIITRGCPYHCTFCSCQAVTGKRIRAHSPNYIIDEIKSLHSRLGIEEVSFIDDNLTADRSTLEELCRQMIKQKLKIPWSCFGVRIDLVDEDILRLMEKSGCYLISVGIESGSQRILDHMQKGLTIDKVKQKIVLIKKITNIKVIGTFILGYPLEEIIDIQKTIKFARSLPLFAAAFYGFHPIPGTQIYEELISKKEIDEKINWDSVGQDKKPYSPTSISFKKFSLLYRWAYISFYARPKVLFNILKEIRSIEKLKFLLNRLLGRLFR